MNLILTWYADGYSIVVFRHQVRSLLLEMLVYVFNSSENAYVAVSRSDVYNIYSPCHNKPFVDGGVSCGLVYKNRYLIMMETKFSFDLFNLESKSSQPVGHILIPRGDPCYPMRMKSHMDINNGRAIRSCATKKYKKIIWVVEAWVFNVTKNPYNPLEMTLTDKVPLFKGLRSNNPTFLTNDGDAFQCCYKLYSRNRARCTLMFYDRRNNFEATHYGFKHPKGFLGCYWDEHLGILKHSLAGVSKLRLKKKTKCVKEQKYNFLGNDWNHLQPPLTLGDGSLLILPMRGPKDNVYELEGVKATLFRPE